MGYVALTQDFVVRIMRDIAEIISEMEAVSSASPRVWNLFNRLLNLNPSALGSSSRQSFISSVLSGLQGCALNKNGESQT